MQVHNDFSNKFLKIKRAASNLQQDFEVDMELPFAMECIHLKGLVRQENFHKSEPLTLSKLHKFLVVDTMKDLYPNVDIALKIYLCTPASNCSADRSFSTLTRIENYLEVLTTHKSG